MSETDEKSDVAITIETKGQVKPLLDNPFTEVSTSINMEQLNISPSDTAEGVETSSTAPAVPPAPSSPPPASEAPATTSGSAVRHLYLLRDIFSLSTAPSPETLRSVYTHTMPRNSSLDSSMTQHPLSSSDRPGANPTRMSESKLQRSTSLREGEKLPLCGGPKREGADSEPGVQPNSDSTTSQNATPSSPTQSDNCQHRNQNNNHLHDNLNTKLVMEIARFLPILFIFLAKFAYDYWAEILYVLLIQIAQFYLNTALKTEVARLENRATVPLIFNFWLGIIVVGWRVRVAPNSPDPIGLILPPPTDCDLFLENALESETVCQFSLGSLLHHAILSDLFLQMLTTVLKIVLTVLPMHDMKFRGRLYALIENISQFYRALTPIHQWCLYFYFIYPDLKAITVVLLSLYLLFKFFDLRFRFTSLKQSIITLQLKIDSKRIPTKEELDKVDNMCAICNDPYKSPVILECGHIFCEGCINQWLQRGETCPICRAKVADRPLYENGSTSASYQIY